MAQHSLSLLCNPLKKEMVVEIRFLEQSYLAPEEMNECACCHVLFIFFIIMIMLK